MPQFKLVSAKEILARVIRSVGYKLPSTYHDDILEWIPEGMGMIQVTNSLITTSTGCQGEQDEIIVKNHCAELPCGFVSILAVEDENGYRVPEGGDITDFRKQSSQRHIGLTGNDHARINVFNVNPFNHQTQNGVPTTKPGSSIPLYGEDLIKTDVSINAPKYYRIKGNYIQTSFESGFIRIHYNSIPVDKEGYPLIPDNENYKQALEWHIIRRLIGAGYEHKVFNYQYANEQFELYAARGMGEVSYWSLDTAARVARSFVRLIPPYRFNDDFFINSEQSERLHK
jgi:hypothetical protein